MSFELWGLRVLSSLNYLQVLSLKQLLKKLRDFSGGYDIAVNVEELHVDRVVSVLENKEVSEAFKHLRDLLGFHRLDEAFFELKVYGRHELSFLPWLLALLHMKFGHQVVVTSSSLSVHHHLVELGYWVCTCKNN